MTTTVCSSSSILPARFTRLLVFVVSCLLTGALLGAVLPGCVSQAEVDEARAEAVSLREQLQAKADELPAGSPERKEADAKVDAVDRDIAAGDRAAAAAGEDRTGEVVGGVLGSFLPGLGAAAPVVLGLAWKSVRLWTAKNRYKGTAEKVVATLDYLKEAVPAVADAVKTQKPTIDKIQGPDVKAEVNKLQAA